MIEETPNILTSQRYFDGLAPAYEDVAKCINWRSPEVVFGSVQAHVVNVDSPCIFDVGIGPGPLSQLFRKAYPEGYITGIDIAPNMLKICRQNAVANRLIQGDIGGPPTPLADNSQDIVVSSGVMEFVENFSVAIAEVGRVLKPGGVFSFTYQCTSDPDDTVINGKSHIPINGTGVSYLFRGTVPPDTVAILNQNGLQVVDEKEFLAYEPLQQEKEAVYYRLFTAKKAQAPGSLGL